MRVFMTGATGFIGSAVVEKLQAGGHIVVGLAHSDRSVAALRGRGIAPVRGGLEDTALLTAQARDAEAVIHLGATAGPGFPDADRRAVDAFLEGLEGSGKRFVYTSGVAVPGDTGQGVGDEEAPLDPAWKMAWRGVTERSALDAAARGVHAIAIRPSMVHGRGRPGMAGVFVEGARGGLVRYVGSGEYRWSTVHVDDIADLYVRVLERADAGEVFIAAADEVVSFRELAEATSRAAGGDGPVASWPLEEARGALGLLADLMTVNAVVSGAKARRTLGWAPHGAPLLAELAGDVEAALRPARHG